MIQVEHISKSYGNHIAVDDLSFTAQKGGIYGFLGPNGAGKSTTMNIMTGYIAAGSGTVKINGFDILREPEKAKLRIGYLPEIPPLYTDMTVREQLLFAAELKRVPRKERAAHVQEIIGRTKLEDAAGRLIKNLSKGYRQRVGLAQALIGYPEALILDEPMVGLDPKQILEMRDLLRELAGEHTILLSSHILSEVSAICDHIMILSHGRLAASGSPEELQEKLQTQAELEVTVLGEKEQAEAVIGQIEQIVSYTFESSEEADSVKLRLRTAEHVDIRKELSVALAGAGMPILAMNRLEKSLEDIFLEVTEQTEADTQEKMETVGEECERGESESTAYEMTGSGQKGLRENKLKTVESKENESEIRYHENTEAGNAELTDTEENLIQCDVVCTEENNETKDKTGLVRNRNAESEIYEAENIIEKEAAGHDGDI